MSKYKYLVLTIALLIGGLIGTPVFAQQVTVPQQSGGTSVTPTGATGVAATTCSSANGSGQQTLTIPNPGAGLSIYATYIAIWGLATGVPTAATPTVATITGIAGTSPALAPLASVYPAAGAAGSVSGGPIPLIAPLKGLTGTALAIVGPTAITNMNQAIEACYYIAP
jgi:hypothetical protein